MSDWPTLARVAVFFVLFRAAYLGLGFAGLAWLWKRPRAGWALALVLGLNLCAWAAYVAPLARLYALGERSDRGFNVGMAACTAADGSPWEHVQVRHAAVEPFWNLLLATLSGFRPERVSAVYQALAPGALVLVALGLYLGLRVEANEHDAWERVWLVFAVLGLASFSFSQRPPVPHFWAGNFLLKPNHAAGFGLMSCVLGLAARRATAWSLGLALGLLAWVFLQHWALAVAALALLSIRPGAERRERLTLAAGALLSLAIAAPDVANLLRDYAPWAHGASAHGVWSQVRMGVALASPRWAIFDMAPLVLLAAAGAHVLWRRAGSRDRALLALLATAWTTWIAYALGAFFGWAPNPDDAHYFLRFATALGAATALAEGARRLEGFWAWPAGRGTLLGLGLLLPLTFPATWDPPTLDRYWPFNRQRLAPAFVEYAAWIREHTPRQAVFAAGPSSATWIPVLAGRRVLLAADARPPADYDERKRVEGVLLTSADPQAIRAAARAWGITHVAIDARLRSEYGTRFRADDPSQAAFLRVYESPALTILRLRD